MQACYAIMLYYRHFASYFTDRVFNCRTMPFEACAGKGRERPGGSSLNGASAGTDEWDIDDDKREPKTK